MSSEAHAGETPSGIDWPRVRSEVLTVGETCVLAGVSRPTLIEWRKRETDPFPSPVLTIPSAHPVNLWARGEVEAWLRDYR